LGNSASLQRLRVASCVASDAPSWTCPPMPCRLRRFKLEFVAPRLELAHDERSPVVITAVPCPDTLHLAGLYVLRVLQF